MQNLKTCRVQVPPVATVMKRKTEVRTLYFSIFDYNIFSFKMEFSLEPLCRIKRHDKYIFTHPPNFIN